LQQFGSLDGVIANAAQIGGVVGDNLRAALEWLPTARALVTIKTDCDLSASVSSIEDSLSLHPEDDPELRDNTVSEWRARLLLRHGRWEEAYQLTQKMPSDLASSNRWRYWNARSLQLAQPNSQQPAVLFQALAKERDFYGFMAADQVKAPYALNNQPLALDPKVVQKVRNTAGIKRAMEFHARGQIVDGRREWYHVSRLFSRDELVAQARLIPLREKVGNKLIHAIRNAYLLSKDGTITVEADADKRNGNKKSRSDNDAGKGGSEGEHSVVAITISEIPRQDVTLLDLLDKTGPVPEPILGAILTQLVAILERLHTVRLLPWDFSATVTASHRASRQTRRQRPPLQWQRGRGRPPLPHRRSVLVSRSPTTCRPCWRTLPARQGSFACFAVCACL
jgi:hypothetical protein